MCRQPALRRLARPGIICCVNAPGQLTSFLRRIVLLGVVVGGLLLLGTLGLALSEKVGPWYAFRWSLDTAATVGGFPQAHSLVGQLVQIGLILLGVGTLFYALATVTEFFVAGHLGDLLAMRRKQRMIDSLTDHHIICGFGRVGRQVARDLHAARVPYVVVDSDAANRHLADDDLMTSFIEGDATDDAVLRQAGIVGSERQGLWAYYYVIPDALKELSAWLS